MLSMHDLSLPMRPAIRLAMRPPPCAQIKEFSEPGSDTAGKDQSAPDASALSAATATAPAASATAAKTLELPAVQVIPHALAKLEKPADEIYTVSSNMWHHSPL